MHSIAKPPFTFCIKCNVCRVHVSAFLYTISMNKQTKKISISCPTQNERKKNQHQKGGSENKIQRKGVKKRKRGKEQGERERERERAQKSTQQTNLYFIRFHALTTSRIFVICIICLFRCIPVCMYMRSIQYVWLCTFLAFLPFIRSTVLFFPFRLSQFYLRAHYT